ncbi:hypothetical protein RUM43_004447 [Polyplax serrata]|uniref:N-sulfoglucosamine sulfohydrolase n=1 Tax=Polyplax serrata TaxID=468196 RepID=A0AAN8SAU8_POLSC
MLKYFYPVFLLTINANAVLSKKNVLFMLADDAGFEMRAYNNKICQTPNLDALAKKSLIFNNAYSADSSCSPSRSAILTGRPNHETGMYGLHQGVHHFNSFDNVKSLPKILNDHGIFTGIIGKKHVGPSSVYPFHYEQTEEKNCIMQVGRNITKMKLLVREFLQMNKTKPFFLYVGFHDPHRCGHTHPQFGAFCEKFGNGDTGNGHIPDWKPIYYQHNDIKVPYFVPNTEAAKIDLSAQYTTISRLDQGIGLILKELEDAGVANDTLVIYTSDNGIPFPTGRTNLYDPGIAQPMFINSPNSKRRNQVTYEMSSHLDIAPTILDWFGISDDSTSTLTGKTLLPLLDEEPKVYNRSVFASHSHHEITMYYPSRAVRTKRYKLIHNLNYQAPFPIDQDLYVSPTFQDVMERTSNKTPFMWNTNLQKYYFRNEWELYDLKYDPEELTNIVKKSDSQTIFKSLKEQLYNWLNETRDPWFCAPHAVLEKSHTSKNDFTCKPLYNDKL